MTQRLTEEEQRRLTDYTLERQGDVTVPQIQVDFGWSYRKAKEGVDGLLNSKVLVDMKELRNEAADSSLSSRQEEQFPQFAIHNRIRLNPLTQFLSEKMKESYRDRLGEAMERALLEFALETASIDVDKEEMEIAINVRFYEALILGDRQKSIKVNGDNKMKGKSFFDLPAIVKRLINSAIKHSSSIESAAYGLDKSAMRWENNSSNLRIYKMAYDYVCTLTNDEFKTRKKLLSKV